MYGRGVGGLAEPEAVLDMGNSGTGARLVMGLVASHRSSRFFAGDASLSARPMKRVIEPLSQMGASFWSRSRGPAAAGGARVGRPASHRLYAAGGIRPGEIGGATGRPQRAGANNASSSRKPTRDHTERMLVSFRRRRSVIEDLADGGRRITLTGQPEIAGRDVVVPGDISSAAFPLVAALLTPGSRITVTGVGINPLRAGLLETLAEMGAGLETVNHRAESAGSRSPTSKSKRAPLTGVEVPPQRVPAMIDEFPILAVAAACAAGATRMHGLGELRVKESDRLAAIADGLAACGVAVEAGPDWLVIHGAGGPPPGGGLRAVQHGSPNRHGVSGPRHGQPKARTGRRRNIHRHQLSGVRPLMNGLGARISEGDTRA